MLSRALWVVASGSELDPYMSTLGAQPISYLLFVDDVLLLGWASFRNMVAFSIILEEYCRASG